MSVSGNLKTMLPGDLLQWLSLGQKTGTLLVSNKGVEKKIFFGNGRVISSASNDPREYLGQFLMSHGYITEEELMKAMEVQQQSRILLGKILVMIDVVLGQGVIWPIDPEYDQKATFAFMISPRKGRQLHAMLQRGEKVSIHAELKAGVGPGEYQVVTATIPGADKAGEEFVLSCHLGHPRPGANDNVSGCAAILEIARSLEDWKAHPPLRPVRFPARGIYPFTRLPAEAGAAMSE